MNTSNITFCINTAKNEINHIKLLFKSLDINLHNKNHDIIVFVDSDNQNTTEWLKTQKLKFKNLTIVKNTSSIPVGYQRNINLMFEMAKTEIVSYLQSDMVISKNYDLDIIKNLDENTVISSTRIEPPLHPPSSEKITHDFGLDPLKFNFESFQLFSNSKKENKLTDYWFAPFTLYRKKWVEIGGHDTLFRRSREDSDILYRLCLNGLKFKQDWNAIVYHFTCTSSRGPEWWKQQNQDRIKTQNFADLIEYKKFLRKWRVFKHDVNYDASDYKYNVSINFKNSKNKEPFILENYFLFNKISVDDINSYNILKTEYSKLQDPANILLGIQTDQWNDYKKNHRTWEFEDIFTSNKIKNDDVIVDVDLNLLDQNMTNCLFNIQEILNNSISEGSSGEFSLLDNMNVTVCNMKNRLSENIFVKNPDLNVNLEFL